jgi:site-specific DNA-methyltransferase (adenine-specific)
MAKIELLNVDCMDFMKDCDDNQFELAIVDPPYGIIESGGQTGGCAGSLENREFNKFQRSGSRWDIKPNKSYFNELARVSINQIIWGGNYFDLPPTRCVLCWDKMQPWDNFSKWEMAWTSFSKPANLFKYDNKTGDKIHPTQKPVKLYEWLLMYYAKEGDKILDTHGGSMSIAIACHNLGFDLTALEIDKEYYDAAVKRFEIHKSQLKIF